MPGGVCGAGTLISLALLHHHVYTLILHQYYTGAFCVGGSKAETVLYFSYSTAKVSSVLYENSYSAAEVSSVLSCTGDWET